MATAIIVQARTGSTRFPNKMTLPFYKETGMLHYLLTRIQKATLPVPVILAIPDSQPNDVLDTIGRNMNLSVFRGSEANVLLRFIQTADADNIDKIIRVCADNPFLDTNGLKTLIDTFLKSTADYIPFSLSDNTPTIKTHFGFWAEGVTLSALKTIANKTSENLYCEHVTNYIYSHPNDFKIHSIPVDPAIENHPWARFTVDTKNDFETMKTLAAELPPFPLSNPNELIAKVASNDTIKRSMQTEIAKNTK